MVNAISVEFIFYCGKNLVTMRCKALCIKTKHKKKLWLKIFHPTYTCKSETHLKF